MWHCVLLVEFSNWHDWGTLFTVYCERPTLAGAVDGAGEGEQRVCVLEQEGAGAGPGPEQHEGDQQLLCPVAQQPVQQHAQQPVQQRL